MSAGSVTGLDSKGSSIHVNLCNLRRVGILIRPQYSAIGFVVIGGHHFDKVIETQHLI